MAYFPHPMVRQFEICIEVVGSGIRTALRALR
jgi:hypothetical protein